jgi:hypothetical protein
MSGLDILHAVICLFEYPVLTVALFGMENCIHSYMHANVMSWYIVNRGLKYCIA